jgi:hypothetical protein
MYVSSYRLEWLKLVRLALKHEAPLRIVSTFFFLDFAYCPEF